MQKVFPIIHNGKVKSPGELPSHHFNGGFCWFHWLFKRRGIMLFPIWHRITIILSPTCFFKYSMNPLAEFYTGLTTKQYTHQPTKISVDVNHLDSSWMNIYFYICTKEYVFMVADSLTLLRKCCKIQSNMQVVEMLVNYCKIHSNFDSVIIPVMRLMIFWMWNSWISMYVWLLLDNGEFLIKEAWHHNAQRQSLSILTRKTSSDVHPYWMAWCYNVN